MPDQVQDNPLLTLTLKHLTLTLALTLGMAQDTYPTTCIASGCCWSRRSHKYRVWTKCPAMALIPNQTPPLTLMIRPTLTALMALVALQSNGLRGLLLYR